MQRVHVIPVPVGWTPEQSYHAIERGALLIHPNGPPGWAAVLTDENDKFDRVLEPNGATLSYIANHHTTEDQQIQ